MRTHGRIVAALSLAITACSSWHGPRDLGGGQLGALNPDASQRDGSVGDSAVRDAQADDAHVADAAASDAAVARLGDERAGVVLCDQHSCTKGKVCCSTNTSKVESVCGDACGVTEAKIACDGPEDCGTGQVCCHRFESAGLITECVSLHASSTKDGGTMVGSCSTVLSGPEERVACHTDSECKEANGSPLCRADAARRPFLGYCSPDTDNPATPGHDDKQVVSCGHPDQNGVGELCSLSFNACCQSRFDPAIAACTSGADCGFSELSVVCDGPEDCSAGVCCFAPAHTKLDAGSLEALSVCAKDCASLGEGAVRRCHVDADCAHPATCQRDAKSPWWGTCAP